MTDEEEIQKSIERAQFVKKGTYIYQYERITILFFIIVSIYYCFNQELSSRILIRMEANELPGFDKNRS